MGLLLVIVNTYAVLGVIEGKRRIILGKQIKLKDVILGVESSGLHSNGYSLARKVLLPKYSIGDQPDHLSLVEIDDGRPDDVASLAERLLTGHTDRVASLAFRRLIADGPHVVTVTATAFDTTTASVTQLVSPD